MASIVAWLTGFLFLGIGGWILLLRFEGFADWVRPYSMSVGEMSVDGSDNQAYAELLRARFDYHFRRPSTIASETGFLEIASLEAPELFQTADGESKLDKIPIEISGVDVGKVVTFINQVVKPNEWVIEGDFRTQPDRVTLALRFSRGDRLVRTWYLERLGNTSTGKSAIIQQLIDDAIFQLIYDFGNTAEQDPELLKWHKLIQAPANFPGPAAVAAYYRGRGALARYYAGGNWDDLDVALQNLRDLRGQMPEFDDGLQLLALALAEKRSDQEAIDVYEQLRLLLRRAAWSQLSSRDKRRILSIDLLDATARAKLDTWQSTHAAIAELVPLDQELRAELNSAPDEKERIAFHELIAHADVQLAYTYALYLEHFRDYAVADVLGSPDAPPELRLSPAEIDTLRGPDGAAAKPIVKRVARHVAQLHQEWLKKADAEEKNFLEGHWGELQEGDRRHRELATRLFLASGYAHYHMAEWETAGSNPQESVFGASFDRQLENAQRDLSRADAQHPNHYVVLQLLGLVGSEPRRASNNLNPTDKNLSLAEQYFGRAVRANPFDPYGHELLANLLFRRVASRGLDLGSRPSMEQGLDEAKKAVMLRETSGNAHLLWAQFLAALLEIERDSNNRRELSTALRQQLDQAERFLPEAFKRPDPDLTWMKLVSAIRQWNDDPDKLRHFNKSKQDCEQMVSDLISDCQRLEGRWVASQRVFHIRSLDERAKYLQKQIQNATPATWQDIDIRFW